MKVTRTSMLSNDTTTRELNVTQAQLDEMALPGRQRRLVQDIFPDLSDADREFIKTGITEAEWAKVFPPEKGELGELEVFTVPQCEGLEVQDIAATLDKDAVAIIVAADRNDEPIVHYVLHAANNPDNYDDGDWHYAAGNPEYEADLKQFD